MARGHKGNDAAMGRVGGAHDSVTPLLEQLSTYACLEH
jgi:hypothetical protein